MTILAHINALFSLSWSAWLYLGLSTVMAYWVANTIYLLYFHPASKFPGPRLAAVSYVPYCYHWISGKFPWWVEKMIKKYGDVVRIGPNELAFYTPQAAMDIYNSPQEHFLKTDLMDFGAGDLGYIWENDPVKRKAVAKKILPAFSSRNVKGMEDVVNEYVDGFVKRMKELGGREEGVLMNDWLLWLASDMAADLAYGREFKQMENGKSSDFISFLRGTSFVALLMQLSKKIPAIWLITPLFIPLNILRNIPAAFKANSEAVTQRLENREKTRHPFMDYMLPAANDPAPTSKKELLHIEQVALQLFIAGFDPIQITLYASLFFVLKNPHTLQHLTREIRNSFGSFESIQNERLAKCEYLNAVIMETLRVHGTATTGLPRISPGAIVDGIYVPKGITVLHSSHTTNRDPQNFIDPLEFRPERWLSPSHPLYSTRYANDNLKAFLPFSVGPMSCAGREMALMQTRLFLGKVLWQFDLEGVKGCERDFDEGFKVWVMWERPGLWVRFVAR